jgi:hypothetical protein
MRLDKENQGPKPIEQPLRRNDQWLVETVPVAQSQPAVSQMQSLSPVQTAPQQYSAGYHGMAAYDMPSQNLAYQPAPQYHSYEPHAYHYNDHNVVNQNVGGIPSVPAPLHQSGGYQPEYQQSYSSRNAYPAGPGGNARQYAGSQYSNSQYESQNYYQKPDRQMYHQ